MNCVRSKDAQKKLAQGYGYFGNWQCNVFHVEQNEVSHLLFLFSTARLGTTSESAAVPNSNLIVFGMAHERYGA